MIEPAAARSARDGIADTLDSIDRGTLDATPEQRAFLAGSVATLDAALADAPAEKGRKKSTD